MGATYVILVDEQDRETGIMEKMEAHQKGLLHRAFSIFIVNPKGEILLQQRATDKYHSGGLWTNTCCSHPQPNESLETAGMRRLQEEMGFSCNVTPKFSFIYKVKLEGGLSEHELDHVLVGTFAGDIHPDPSEVMDYKWVSLENLQLHCAAHPEHYTSWLQIILNQYAYELKRALAV